MIFVVFYSQLHGAFELVVGDLTVLVDVHFVENLVPELVVLLVRCLEYLLELSPADCA